MQRDLSKVEHVFTKRQPASIFIAIISFMSQYNIDIDEQDWLDKYGNEVLEHLLWEHSLEQYVDDNGEKCHHHIYWATDNYEQNGFIFFDEIRVEDITGDNRKLIRPRADKSKEEQLKRTRDKAEVFTPSWVCNAQNNLIDDAWFGRANVFNVADEKSHTWQATTEPIVFPEGKTWQDYVSDNRLEVACGEAPYLVSPYDTTTGVVIPLFQRIGLLDRKLRVVNENVEPTEWIKWAMVAVKSTYGFEWQGDNLLLARESILHTVIEYYEDFASKHNLRSTTLQNKTLQTFAYIISWNMFQMDGTKMVLPNSCKESVLTVTIQANLFEEPTIETHKVPCQGCKKNDVHAHTGIYAKVADWAKDDSSEPIEIVSFHSLIKKL